MVLHDSLDMLVICLARILVVVWKFFFLINVFNMIRFIYWFLACINNGV